MVSEFAMTVFTTALVLIVMFTLRMLGGELQKKLLHKLYMWYGWAIVCWIVPVMLIGISDASNTSVMFFLDCLMQPGGALCAPLYLCISISFVNGYEKMTKWMKYIFIVPVITTLIAWTNPLHHLQYVHFSVVRSEIVFGPYVIVSGLSNYIFQIVGIVYVLRFAIKNKTPLYWKQSILFVIGGLFPLFVSMYATFSGNEVPISATPMSFMVTAVCNGIAIYQLHMLDITPIATKHILEAISDGYLVISESGIVLDYNKRFEKLLGSEHKIVVNRNIKESIRHDDANRKNPVYNMLTAIESSRQGGTQISYEQAVAVGTDNNMKMKHFVVDVSPLEIYGKITGFSVLFKDITQLHESMQKLHDSQERMMEQERMAFLGQMIGGIAHNLKTPIMSISGCIAAVDNLVEECEESLSDPQVVEEDYREIYAEMREWHQKMKDSTAYMSDIITAIKGQAANISMDEKSTFTLDEMLKRSTLLMRHELLNGGCQLKIQNELGREVTLQGDVNNLIQAVNNLVSNAIYAQKQNGGGAIDVSIYKDEEYLQIAIKDRGKGVSPHVRAKLFKSMVTSKGTLGTGLGLYISSIVIKGKFEGHLWMEDREGGGSIFGIAIPLRLVNMR